MFEFLNQLYQIILFQPLFNLLVLLYLPFKNLGLAIFFVTLLIKGLLFPLDLKNLKFQKLMSEIQPKILEIQSKYKDNQDKQVEEIMKIYKNTKLNPFAGFLPLLVQTPIFVAIFQIFRSDLNSLSSNLLYSFVPQIGHLQTLFLGIDLAAPSLVLAAATQFFQTKFLTEKTTLQTNKKQTKQEAIPAMLQKQMIYMFPILTFFILTQLPSALGLYWTIMSIFTIIQQYFIFKKQGKENYGRI